MWESYMSLLAKSIIKNKCWLVEDNGKKVGALLSNPAGYTLVSTNNRRERFSSVKSLKDKYDIIFDKSKIAKPDMSGTETYDVYGYTTDFKPHNQLWDVHHKLPVCTKDAKSKSYYCPGWYLIKFGQHWEEAYCPKFISLARYPYSGPYKTQQETQENLSVIRGY